MPSASASNRFAPKNSARRPLFKGVGEWSRDIGIAGAQDTVHHFMHLARRVAKRALRQRIQYPNVTNSHLEIIRQFLVEPRDRVFSRKNFDTEERRLTNNGITRIGGQEYAYVRDPKARRTDLNTLRHQDADTRLSFLFEKQEADGAMGPAVWLLA
jgi:hypothetical protein